MNNSELMTRILAIALALFLWAYVRVQHDMPDVQRDIQNVPVQLEGKPPAGLAPQLRDEDRTITVQIKGPADRVNGVVIDDVKAKVDCTSINDEGTARLRVKVFLPNGVHLAQPPQDVTVITRKLAQKKFPVIISFLPSPSTGSTIGEYLIDPSTVTVEGPAEDGGQSALCLGIRESARNRQANAGAACARRRQQPGRGCALVEFDRDGQHVLVDRPAGDAPGGGAPPGTAATNRPIIL